MKWFPIFLVFFVPSAVMAYQSIITNSYEWAKQRSHRLFIDDSHNHIHSREVFNHFLDMRSCEPLLQERFPNYSEKFRCAALGCLLHDMMDKKYKNLIIFTEGKTITDYMKALSKIFHKEEKGHNGYVN
jgi:hypothetical protein